jgi:hypothetical protein
MKDCQNTRSSRCRGPAHQRGMVTLLTLLFLIATVVFGLAQMLNVSSGNVADGQRQGDSTAAFFLAESGLEKAHASLVSAITLTDSVCSDVTTLSGPLGRGSISSLVGTPSDVPCGGNGQPTCRTCTLTSTGTVGVATRTLTQSIGIQSVDGVACTANPSTACTNTPAVTWWLDLKNPYSVDAIGVFSLAVLKQGANSGATCTNAACQLAWDSRKMTGQHAVASMGNVVTIPAGSVYKIYQTGSSDDLAQVGMLFRGSTAAPTLTGRHSSAAGTVAGAAYWDTSNGNGTSTTGKYKASLTGQTNDGTATDSNSEVCLDPTNSHNTTQTCTSWCYGGDTLVFGFAAEASSLADDITSVTFNTGGTAAQNIPLTAFITERKYPTASTSNNPPTTVYSSLWYVRNPDYLSASNVRSGALATGYVGSAFTGTISKNSTTLTVSGLSGAPLQVGSIISGSGSIDTNTKICSFGTGTGGNGTYSVSSGGSCSTLVGQSSNYNNKAMTVQSSVMTITSATLANLAAGDTIFVNGVSKAMIASLGTGTGGVGTYNLSTATQFSSATNNITSDGTTITSASGTAVPTAGTILAVKSGTGVFGSGMTKVTGTPSATTFTVSTRPSTPLVNATVCGGTCGLFVHGGQSTQFTIAKSSSDLSWAAGFVCLKGVDVDPEKVTTSTITSGSWTEVVR